MTSLTVHDRVLDAIMAGDSASAIRPDLLKLSPDDRQGLLCFICSIHNEIACTSRQHGAEVADLLESECPLFVGGRATCLGEN